ncbi:hypothetical protein [Stenotrophomonas sp. MYb238]|uniref:hypothetical protein n=1 Tax=Stenotrophomonas sp. MYb238 TaxID=2040281 RepID=UPI001290BAE1|nr:hypothetical protein [Stenotrophomonas sp. MYb238]
MIMPLYRCSICGENFPGDMLGEASPIGFYTTRFVVADSPGQAEMLALDALRREDFFNIPAEKRSEDAKVFFEEIAEIAPDTERTPNTGFTFFVMGT